MMIYVKLARLVPNRASADWEVLMAWARCPQMAQTRFDRENKTNSYRSDVYTRKEDPVCLIKVVDQGTILSRLKPRD